jgi:hypothetical protein
MNIPKCIRQQSGESETAATPSPCTGNWNVPDTPAGTAVGQGVLPTG